jgi:hypothetical protein
MNGAYNEDDEEEWPKWTALRGTALTLDNVPLVEVFKRIQTQLEILKNRPVFDVKKVQAMVSQKQPVVQLMDRKSSKLDVKPSNSYLPVITEPAREPPQFPSLQADMFVSSADFSDMVAFFESRFVALESKEVVQADNSAFTEQLHILQNQLNDLTDTTNTNMERMENLFNDQQIHMKEKVTLNMIAKGNVNFSYFRLKNCLRL